MAVAAPAAHGHATHNPVRFNRLGLWLFFFSESILFVYNMINSWIRGPLAGDNPWQVRTLEWQVSSPPPLENFPTPPVVQGHPYDYGVPGSVHGVFPGQKLGGVPVVGGGGGQ